MEMKELKLPKDMTPETTNVIATVYGKIGSIRKCETKEDFSFNRGVDENGKKTIKR